MVNKRGWIRIVEAFIAVLLVTGTLLIVINEGYIGTGPATKIYEMEISILRQVELNDSLRTDVLNVVTIPVESSNALFPVNVKNTINKSLILYEADYLNCTIKICSLTDTCVLDYYPDVDTYAQQAAITSNLESYNPRQLKLFCWIKES